jgi:hypothetical protein
MPFDLFARSIQSCTALPESVIQRALEIAQGMDDMGRSALWRGLQQEYAQYLPLVQRKIERMEHVMADIEMQRKPKQPKGDHTAEKLVLRQLGGMLS